MAIKKATAKPVNMMDTFNALNSAASGAPAQQTSQAPARTVEIQPVGTTQTETVPVKQLSNDGIPTVAQVQAQVAKQEAKPVSTGSTEKTMISLRLLKNDKEKFQEFFKSCGLSFTDGLYMAADFIEREVEAGRLQMSKSGIQYK